MYEQGHILLNTDWLALSLRLDEGRRQPINGHKWVDYDGTNVWKSRRVLLNGHGEKVATLLSEPKSSIIAPNSALLEVANEWLYHGIGARGVVSLVRYAYESSIVGLSRLDLCVDFEPSERQAEIIRGLAEGRYYVGGKRSGSGFWSTLTADWVPAMWKGVCPHCQSWGHKTTAVKWKLYYKSLELREAGGGWFAKPYIVDRWRECGFDVNNVWRLEVSMHSCNQMLYSGEALRWEKWGMATADIFCALYKQRFVVRKAAGHADKSNDPIVEFLPIKSPRELVRTKPSSDESRRNARIGLLRSLVRSTDAEEVLYDTATLEGVLAHVKAIVERDHLQHYFKAMVGDNYAGWATKLREAGGGDMELRQDVGMGITPNKSFS